MDGSSRTEEARRPRRRSEQAVLRSIIERLADGVLIADAGGRIRFVNPAAERMLGRDRAELLGEEFGFPILLGETTEIDVVRRGGSPLTAELRVVETEWEGAPAKLISLRDITDRKEAERHAQALAAEQRARLEAEAASQAKSDFLAVMSHELRTPLNAVLGYSELLDLGLAGPLTEEQRQQVGRIRASGKHLLTLVNEVLDLAKVEAGRLSVDRSPYRAVHVADSTLVLVQPQADARGLTLTRGYEPDSALTYIGDEDRVRQILVNLLSNAIKFTGAGGRVTLSIDRCERAQPRARVHGRGPWICFTVTDTGEGIAADRLEEIFAPFVQVQSGRTRRSDGSGLGLTISRRLARLMGGDLTVQSTLGGGSTFTLLLPEARTDAPHAPQAPAPLTGREPRVQGFADVGEALLREVEAVVDTVVNRMRSEPRMPRAHTLSFSQLADHVGTLVSDIATTLVVLEESAGAPSSILADGADIQRLLSERHGAQRARLGWSTDALRREHELLREEIERAMRRCFLGETDGRLAEAMTVIGRLVGHSEEIAVRTLERTLSP